MDCSKVEKYSNEYLFKLLDMNIVGKFTYLPSLLNMDVSSDNKATIINTGIPSDMLNIVCLTKRKDAINIAIEKFRTLRFAWWVGFDDDYAECKNDLVSKGFVCDEHESAMFVEIEKLSFDKKCNELQISLVDDEKRLNDFITIYQDLIPHDYNQIKEFYTRAEKHILDSKSSLKLFVGYFQNQPVSTSALFMDKYTAGVWDVVTIPKFRRKGIGTDMTLHTLLYAYGNFRYSIGVLTASEKGEPIYRKIGFQKLKDFYVFNITINQIREAL